MLQALELGELKKLAASKGIASEFLTGTKFDILQTLSGGEDLRAHPEMRRPTTYHTRAALVRDFYDRDGLFSYLVDRLVHFASTRTKLRTLSAKDKNLTTSELIEQTMENKGLSEKTRKEQRLWDWWAQHVNMDLDNTLPGIDALKRVTAKNLALDAMSTVVCEISKVTFEGADYQLPMRITTLPYEATALVRDLDEKDFIPRELIFIHTGQNLNLFNIPVTKRQAMKGDYFLLRQLREFDGKITTGKRNRARNQFGMSVKWNHSPSDPSTLGASLVTKGMQQGHLRTSGLYPNPPFTTLQPSLTIRQQGEASDMGILDGLINQILIIKVGDDKHPIEAGKKDAEGNVIEAGTLEAAANMITMDDTKALMQLLIPHYFDISKLETDSSTLVSPEKYIHATLTVWQHFGVFLAPPQVQSDFADTNRANLEEMLDFLSGHYNGFLFEIMTRMVEWNKPNLTTVPTIFNLPTNTKTEAYLTNLQSLRERGEVSHQTLLDHIGLDAGYEQTLILSELATGMKELIDENVPITFVQATSEEEGGAGGGAGGKGSKKKTTKKTPGKKKVTRQSKPSGKRVTNNRTQRKARPGRKVVSGKKNGGNGGTGEGEEEGSE